MRLAEIMQRSELTEKAVRHYENEGLIRPSRGDNGRRIYSSDDLSRLQFLARARRLGFPLNDCRQLLQLKSTQNWTADEVHAIAESHLEALERKMLDLKQMAQNLRTLIDTCPAGKGQKCKVMFALSDDESSPILEAKVP